MKLLVKIGGCAWNTPGKHIETYKSKNCIQGVIDFYSEERIGCLIIT
jgi:hypothetical protein